MPKLLFLLKRCHVNKAFWTFLFVMSWMDFQSGENCKSTKNVVNEHPPLLIMMLHLLHRRPLRFEQEKEREEQKVELKDGALKPQCCNFSPPGGEVNRKFPSGLLSLTLMSCLLWDGSSPWGWGSLTSPRPPQAPAPSRVKEGKKEKSAGEEKLRVVFWNGFGVMQDKVGSLFCSRRRVSPWQGPHSRREMQFKCPEYHWKVRQTRGFAFECDRRMLHMDRAGPAG